MNDSMERVGGQWPGGILRDIRLRVQILVSVLELKHKNSPMLSRVRDTKSAAMKR